jgi:hypothetical protein
MELPGKTLMFEVNPTQLEESKPSIQWQLMKLILQNNCTQSWISCIVKFTSCFKFTAFPLPQCFGLPIPHHDILAHNHISSKVCATQFSTVS